MHVATPQVWTQFTIKVQRESSSWLAACPFPSAISKIESQAKSKSPGREHVQRDHSGKESDEWLSFVCPAREKHSFGLLRNFTFSGRLSPACPVRSPQEAAGARTKLPAVGVGAHTLLWYSADMYGDDATLPYMHICAYGLDSRRGEVVLLDEVGAARPCQTTTSHLILSSGACILLSYFKHFRPGCSRVSRVCLLMRCSLVFFLGLSFRFRSVRGRIAGLLANVNLMRRKSENPRLTTEGTQFNSESNKKSLTR